ncbi:MAG: FtsX-like permease family protein [Spirochaetota bacterium]
MRNPRLAKIIRDSVRTRGRLLLMTAAVAASIIGIASVMTAYSILTREIRRNYLGTAPASATIELDRIDDALVAAVRTQDGIASVEARDSVLVRAQTASGDWRPLLLFVIPDFHDMRLSKVSRDRGAWPPPEGSMLVERSAVSLMTDVGGTLAIRAPSGVRRDIFVAGTAHDPGLAPAWQERTGYGYITPGTFALLGGSGMHELKVRVSDALDDDRAIDARVRTLASWINARGYSVREIQIPPAKKHPHQNQMTAILTMLFIFSLLALVLSGILMAAMVSVLMAGEIRQIGVMKAIGGKTSDIVFLYLAEIAAVSVASLCIGIPLGTYIGTGYAAVVAELLNFTLYSTAVPMAIHVGEAAVGMAIPLLLSLIPVLRASRMTVREAVSDYGVRTDVKRTAPILPDMFRTVDRTLILAIRNLFRRRGRLALTLGLLASAGALFMTALNVNAAWKETIDRSFRSRHYDAEIRTIRPESVGRVRSVLLAVPGIRSVEGWGHAPASANVAGGIEISHVYPDGGHGSFTLRGMPAGSTLVTFPLREGRWLRMDDTNAVMLNQIARLMFPDIRIGGTIPLTVSGGHSEWRVVGFIEEIGPAAAYTSRASFDAVMQSGIRSFRIVTAPMEDAKRAVVIRSAEKALVENAVGVSAIIADAEFRNAITEHVSTLISSIVFIAVLMGIVGMLGLASTTSTNILERTREIGVMRAIGGTPNAIYRNLVSEAVFIGLISIVLATVLSLPLTTAVGRLLGSMAFRTPLPLVISPVGLSIAVAAVVLGSIAASIMPARRASQLTIRETIAYE